MSAIDPIETFRQEASDLLDLLEQSLLDLERRPDDMELVSSAFRALHTLKGSGAMFGFTAVSTFIHEFEIAFDRVRKGEVAVSDALIVVALRAKDHVSALIEDEAQVDPAQGASILGSLARTMDDPCAPETAGSDWTVRFRLHEQAIAHGTNPALLLEEMRSLGRCEILDRGDPADPVGEIAADHLFRSWTVSIEGSVARDAIEDVFLFIRDETDLSITKADVDEETLATASDPAGRATAAAEAETQTLPHQNGRGATLRVPAERLDELMDRVGELVIAQARLAQIAGASHDPALVGVAEDIERLTASLRDTTMGTRMVPIGSLFGRFRRLVHDLSDELGKPVALVTEGEETELDKTVIEQLADPLVHLIRNAMDHGIEAGESRRSGGKREAATLRLAAQHRGAEVAITIADDGAGLDTARIKAKAEANGLIPAGSALSESEIHRLIFEAGFSTAASVTSLSGRGVGMDVVKRTVEGLRGSIDIASEPGHGTEVTLRLPLTLAIIDGLLVRVGSGRYTIPLAAVEECIELPHDADAMRGRSFLDVRGELVPFMRLRDLFHADGMPDVYPKVVVVSSGDMRVGLVVDQIIGSNQKVIKKLSRLHSGLKTFSGATILGDGTVALILDVMHLVGFGQEIEAQRRQQPRRAA
ncbi:MAG: chemotaxis protein CheA [Fulvimarina manganoxydans]|uniref:chemotaxis protein CheA n=1 Tax=Fulvimarina manganoxydans TaxID=937218 RepID=UPI002356CA4C|nr:chemotaxis protein CheA [Fulvimarina manganoxydans]MCK5931043.1 chemotaxis protein CheA [Fulvimarina manganoxydans]